MRCGKSIVVVVCDTVRGYKVIRGNPKAAPLKITRVLIKQVSGGRMCFRDKDI